MSYSITNEGPLSINGGALELAHAHERLFRRARALSDLRHPPLLMHRAELSALLHLMEHGNIAVEEVWQIVLGRAYLSSSVTIKQAAEAESDELYAQALSCLRTVWFDLKQLLEGGSEVTPLAPRWGSATNHDRLMAFERDQAERWFGEVVYWLGVLDHQGILTEYEVTDLLPPEIHRRINDLYDDKWRRSPLTVGASLEALPSIGGTCFGPENGAALLRTLAGNVLRLITALTGAKSPDEEAVMVYQLDLMWQLLKGFVYSMVQGNTGTMLVGRLVRDAELLENVADALIGGLNVLGPVLTANPGIWAGHGGELHHKIYDTPTPRLIEELRAKVAEGARNDSRKPPQ